MTPSAVSPELAHLLAVASRCQDEGQLNLNKMLEAAAFAELRRAARWHQPAITRDSLGVDLAATIAYLKTINASLELIAVMERGLQAWREERGADLLYEEAPDAYVCRVCGHISLSRPPERCPDCGAWPGGFRRFTAVFNMDNTDPMQPAVVTQLLEDNAAALAMLVSDLPQEALERRPGPNDWSISDHLAHFYEVQIMLETRVRRLLSEENPDLAGASPYRLAQASERRPDTVHGLLAGFRVRRALMLAALRRRPVADFYRAGRHSEFGPITLLRQAAYVAYHEQSHLPEVEALRRDRAS